MKKILLILLLLFFTVPILIFAEDKLWYDVTKSSEYQFAYFYDNIGF